MLRRSSRARQPPITFSPSTRNSVVAARITTSSQHKNETRVKYALNKDKAIKKKLEATNREAVCDIIRKPGGNIVICLTTAAYEIVKGAILQHYTQNYMERVDITPKKDQDDAIVEHIVTLYKDHTKSKKSKLYTINLYHTTSKILTNGHNPNICIDHIQRILSEINEDEIKHLNDYIRKKCHEVGDSSGVQPDHNGPINTPRVHITVPAIQAAGTSTPNDILQESIDTRNTENEGIGTVMCPYCNLPAQTESIECAKCSQWVHTQCEGLGIGRATEYEANENHSFTCKLCITLSQNHEEANIHGDDSAIITPDTQPETISDTTHLKLPATAHCTQTNTTISSRVGNSHLQANKEQNPPSTAISAITELTPDTTHLKLPATSHCTQTNTTISSRVGNSHLHANKEQNPPSTAISEFTPDTTHLKLPATSHCTQTNTTISSRVGNSHLHANKEQNPPSTAISELTPDTTHLKLPATSHCTQTNTTISSRVGNSHLHANKEQNPPSTAISELTPDTTHLKLPATSHCTQTNTTISSRVGNSHLQAKKKQTSPITELTTDTTHLKQTTTPPSTKTNNSTSKNITTVVPVSTVHTQQDNQTSIQPVSNTDTQSTKRKPKKKDNFQLTDLEKQLAYCKSEIIRLENCCKEYQNTIQILKLKLATTLPEQNDVAQHRSPRPDKQTPVPDMSLDIRLATLEAQMSILREKVEVQHMMQELREERRQIQTTVRLDNTDMAKETQRSQVNLCNHTCATADRATTATPVTTDAQSLEAQITHTQEVSHEIQSVQHFLCHGRASTNSARNMKPQTITEYIGQPLFVQTSHQTTNTARAQLPYTKPHHSQTLQKTLEPPNQNTQAPYTQPMHLQTHQKPPYRTSQIYQLSQTQPLYPQTYQKPHTQSIIPLTHQNPPNHSNQITQTLHTQSMYPQIHQKPPNHTNQITQPPHTQSTYPQTHQNPPNHLNQITQPPHTQSTYPQTHQNPPNHPNQITQPPHTQSVYPQTHQNPPNHPNQITQPPHTQSIYPQTHQNPPKHPNQITQPIYLQTHQKPPNNLIQITQSTNPQTHQKPPNHQQDIQRESAQNLQKTHFLWRA